MGKEDVLWTGPLETAFTVVFVAWVEPTTTADHTHVSVDCIAISQEINSNWIRCKCPAQRGNVSQRFYNPYEWPNTTFSNAHDDVHCLLVSLSFSRKLCQLFKLRNTNVWEHPLFPSILLFHQYLVNAGKTNKSQPDCVVFLHKVASFTLKCG